MLAFGTLLMPLQVSRCKCEIEGYSDVSSANQKASLVACGVYYYAWIHLLPKIGRYQVRQEIIQFEDGSSSHRLVKVPNADLEKWDIEHDEAGRLVSRSTEQVFVNVNDKTSDTGVSV